MSQKNLKQLLRYEDRNSMRFSIESRTPFADDIELINYIFKIPSVYKIRHGWSKSLLRNSMKNVIPNEICYRIDKIGFETPEAQWLIDIKDKMLLYTNNEQKHILNIDALIKDWDKMVISRAKGGNPIIWRYINFIIWQSIFNVNCN